MVNDFQNIDKFENNKARLPDFFIMKNGNILNNLSRSYLAYFFYIVVGIIGIIDYFIGPDYSSLIVYLIPVIIVTRFVGKKAGIFASLASATCWILADILSDPNYTLLPVHFWNHFENLLIFLIIVFILIKLRRIEEERKNMISMLAHDMKNPALVAKGFSSRLLKGKMGSLTKKQEEKVRLINNELTRLERLILDFLEISRLESNRFKLSPAPFDISLIIKKHIEAINDVAKEKNISVSLDTSDEDIPLVFVDSVQIDRVIRNLLGNALNYTDEGGLIEIKIFVKKNNLVITVKDTGRGISQEHIKNVFTPFYRGGNEPGGTGLGLPIVKSIIKAHGGNIWVESEPGKGSIFNFSLPVVKVTDKNDLMKRSQ